LKIPLRDVFRLVMDEILEDIFEYLTDRTRPARVKPEQMDLTSGLDQVPL
jgi:hypothetical protein